MIVFDINGTLRNGHHRLEAIVRSGATVEFTVWFNAPVDAWLDFDNGKARDAASMLEIDKGDKIMSARTIISIARVILAMLRHEKCGNASFRLVYDKITQIDVFIFAKDNLPAVQDAYRDAKAGKNSKTYTTILAALVYMAKEKGHKDSVLHDFCHKMATGEQLEQQSPVLAFRNRMDGFRIKSNGDRVDVLNLMIKTFNYFIQDKKVAKMQIPEEYQRIMQP